MTNLNFYFLILVTLCTGVACNTTLDPETDTGTINNYTPYEGTTDNSNGDNAGDHEDDNDYVWDSTKVVDITLNQTVISSAGPGVQIDGSTVTIVSAGTYRLSGTLTDGQVIVNTEDQETVKLILDGAAITCTSSAPLYVENAEKTVVILAENTVNSMTDGSSYVFSAADVDEPNAAVFSKDDLTIYGKGLLRVSANYNDGIASKDGLIIKNCTVTINAVDDGIRGKDYLIIKEAAITVTASGDGLKSDNDEDTAKGYIYIENGNLSISCQADAIDAETDVLVSDGQITLQTGGGSTGFVGADQSIKGIKGGATVIIDNGEFSINSADDALHSNGHLVINAGTFTLASGDDAIHADESITINEGKIDISKCVEGIESNYIVVNGGTIHVTASDDCFNSTAGQRTERDDKSCTYIHGGTIVLNAGRGDGLDSNGSIEMTAGTVIIHGPSEQPEVMIDYNGIFNLSGGFLVSSGSSSNMTQAPSSSSTQYSLKIMLSRAVSSLTLFHIADSNGNNVVTFQPLHRFQSVVFSSNLLESGKTYTIYQGGSCNGTNNDGLYTDGTYSGGTKLGSFTISSIVTDLRISN